MFGGDGSNYPSHSGRILDVKDKLASAIATFAGQIDPMLAADIAVCYAPSHKPLNTDTGIRRVAQAVAGSQNRIDATECLVRTKEIPKLTAGGDRSIQTHLDSIAVRVAGLIQGRDVVVLDDVTTSGGSLRACRRLLLDAGARRVKLLALGQTT